MGQDQQVRNVVKLLSNPDFLAIEGDLKSLGFLSLLGMTHKERWHSAFIAWLLNPKASHELEHYPLQRLLYAMRDAASSGPDAEKRSECLPRLDEIEALSATSYDVWPDPSGADRGKELSVQWPEESKSRLDFDVCVAAQMLPRKERGNNTTAPWKLLLVVEMKVYAPEGEGQTTSYAEWASSAAARSRLFGDEGTDADSETRRTALLFLTPDGDDPKSAQFVPLRFQRLVDDVLGPCRSHPSLSAQGRVLIDEYLRNLASPAGDAETGRLAASPDEQARVGRLCDETASRDALVALDEVKQRSAALEEGVDGEASHQERITLYDLKEGNFLRPGQHLRYQRAATDREVVLQQRGPNFGIEVDGEIISAPSAAARAILRGAGKSGSGLVCRGWDRFKLKDAGSDNDGLSLDALRRRLQEQKPPKIVLAVDPAFDAFANAVLNQHRQTFRVIGEVAKRLGRGSFSFATESKERLDFSALAHEIPGATEGRISAFFKMNIDIVAAVDLRGASPKFYFFDEDAGLTGSQATKRAAENSGKLNASGAYQWAAHWLVGEGAHKDKTFLAAYRDLMNRG